ncbi:MAG: hypothetical protein PHI63_03385 [Patescibacteria group bacterium]|nr:hypothetical protein [Patescibacteria group bacterium]
MPNKPQIIISQIAQLLEELRETLGEKSDLQSRRHFVLPSKRKASGVTGGINTLIHENFFDTPRSLSTVRGKLREMGYFYSDPAIATKLLRLVKSRDLNRIFNQKDNKWEYVIRK